MNRELRRSGLDRRDSVGISLPCRANAAKRHPKITSLYFYTARITRRRRTEASDREGRAMQNSSRAKAPSGKGKRKAIDLAPSTDASAIAAAAATKPKPKRRKTKIPGATVESASGRQVKEYNTLTTAAVLGLVRPALVTHWLVDGSIDPDCTSRHQTTVARWRCESCDVVFERPVATVFKLDRAECDYCLEVHMLRNACPTLLEELLAALEEEKMPARPNETIYSGSVVRWRCARCDHRWWAAVCDRATPGEEEGCPRCGDGGAVRSRAELDGSLADLCPAAAADWRRAGDKNRGTEPEQMSPHSGRFGQWRCCRGHDTSERVYLRVSRDPSEDNDGCSRCCEEAAGLSLDVGADSRLRTAFDVRLRQRLGIPLAGAGVKPQIRFPARVISLANDRYRRGFQNYFRSWPVVELGPAYGLRDRALLECHSEALHGESRKTDSWDLARREILAYCAPLVCLRQHPLEARAADPAVDSVDVVFAGGDGTDPDPLDEEGLRRALASLVRRVGLSDDELGQRLRELVEAPRG